MLCLKYAHSAPLPFPGQTVDAPFSLMRDGGEQSDRQGVKFEFFEDVVQ